MNRRHHHRPLHKQDRSLHGDGQDDDDDDEGDDDVFTALSSSRHKNNKNNKLPKIDSSSHTTTSSAPTATVPSTAGMAGHSYSNPNSNRNSIVETTSHVNPNTTTASSSSSISRHHHPSASRAAKMDSLLQELQETAAAVSTTSSSTALSNSTSTTAVYNNKNNSDNNFYLYDRPLPEKLGSYCLPGEELVTANLFVGNLAPSTTEEELAETFRQFGDLYSVKIMWPRTEEERLRGRNTGFVCFMNRDDALEAMDYYQESDPWKSGHKMVIRWGKNVKNTVKRGTGGISHSIITSTRATRKQQDATTTSSSSSWAMRPSYDSNRHLLNSTNSNSNTLTHDLIDPMTTIHATHTALRLEDNADTTNNATYNMQLEQNGIIENDVSAFPKIDIPKYNPKEHEQCAIRVIPPSDPQRYTLITTVAFYVAEDGSVLEKKILEREGHNPKFQFMNPTHVVPAGRFSLQSHHINTQQQIQSQEYIFYRWRVFSFAQGDGFQLWRTEPFIMILNPSMNCGGRFWIPPPIRDIDAARLEEQAVLQREQRIRVQQEERRRIAADTMKSKENFMTGRQLEHAKFSGVVVGSSSKNNRSAVDGSSTLNDSEMKEWDDIIHNRLCSSREAISDAMCFCFDRSTAAVQISELLSKALLDDRRGVSVDTRIARLFLLSDVLFNSQQPGVKNAYKYRDAIEKNSPDIFSSLGRHGQKYGESVGRMTMNKLRNAVKSVISAWSDWSVYNNTFLDELLAHFDGTYAVTSNDDPLMPAKDDRADMKGIPDAKAELVTDSTISIDSDLDGEELEDGDYIPDDIDGESLDDSELAYVE